MKKNLVKLTALILVLGICIGMGSAYASEVIHDRYEFISDSRWSNGVSWGANKRSLLNPYSYYGCSAYCADYVEYCFGSDYPRGGEEYYNVSEIRAGDVIILGDPDDGTGHWLLVLERSGNRLYIAEGNYSQKVRIGWNYTIGNGKLDGDSYNRRFTAGYHYLDAAEEEEYSGWKQVDGKRYYYDAGIPLTGWQEIDGKWYCFNGSGAMKTGWVKAGGKYYYLDPSTGALKTGWVKYQGNYYYMDPSSGTLKTGWVKYKGKYYYMDPSTGTLKTGWLKYKGDYYYLSPDTGTPVTGKQKIGGKTYQFNSSGVCIG